MTSKPGIILHLRYKMQLCSYIIETIGYFVHICIRRSHIATRKKLHIFGAQGCQSFKLFSFTAILLNKQLKQLSKELSTVA